MAIPSFPLRWFKPCTSFLCLGYTSTCLSSLRAGHRFSCGFSIMNKVDERALQAGCKGVFSPAGFIGVLRHSACAVIVYFALAG
jgi:hypothetical protein